MEQKNLQRAHDECLDHLEEQSVIIKNLELLQNETQQGKANIRFLESLA